MPCKVPRFKVFWVGFGSTWYLMVPHGPHPSPRPSPTLGSIQIVQVDLKSLRPHSGCNRRFNFAYLTALWRTEIQTVREWEQSIFQNAIQSSLLTGHFQDVSSGFNVFCDDSRSDFAQLILHTLPRLCYKSSESVRDILITRPSQMRMSGTESLLL